MLSASDELSSSAGQDRLARILDDYLIALEQGTPLAPQELLDRYPEDAEQLRGYLSGLQLFHRAAAVPHIPTNNRIGSPETSETIGDYCLVRELGRGGMGIVYEAWQMSLRRRVALKVLPFTAAHDAKQIGRFKNEAQAAAQVQHPSIVPIFAVGEEQGVHFYVMQLIAGLSLTKWLEERRGPGNAGANTSAPDHDSISAAETADHVRVVAQLGIQAAEALHAAHEYGVVHRDVKPSNLLLDDQGKLWITDFGLARCRENEGLTQSGDILGTMRYMSPEQALGRTELIDHRTDVYSLGVTLYELATLVHPAAGASDLQLYFDRGRANIKPLQYWNRQIPVDFQTVVMKAVSEFPQERYSTAAQLAADLQRFLDGKPILASPPTLATRASKWAKRHRRVLVTASLVAMVGLLAHTLMLTREQASTRRALDRARASLQQAHSVLDRLTQLGDQLAAIPGAEGVRQQLLQDSVSFYRQFEEQANDDAYLADETALAHNKLGGLAEKMGDRDLALEYYTKACRMWEDRVAEQPSNAEFLRNLAVCRNNLGMLLSELGRASESIDLLRKACRIQRGLLAKDARSHRLAVDLATTHSNLGMIFTQTGSLEDATKEFSEAIEIQEPLAKVSSDNEVLLRSLAATYNNFGAAIEKTDVDRAAEAYQKAIALQRRLVKTNPVNRIHQADLARTYNNLGYLSSRRTDWKKAELCYSDAIRIQQNLVKASPFAAAYRRDLAISYNNLGMAQTRSAGLKQAELSFREAVRLQQQLLRAQPKDVQTLSNQGSVFNNLGMLLDRRQQLTQAEAAYQQAIVFQQRAVDAAPNDARLRELLNRHYVNYMANLRRQGKSDAAQEISQRRKTLLSGQPDGQPLPDVAHRAASGRPKPAK
jgi:serine/threonine protein kinase